MTPEVPQGQMTQHSIAVQWVCDSLLTKLHEHFVPSVFESITNFLLVAENPCKAIPLDFVFVIDSSRSIRSNDYEKVKTFIINLLQFLDIGHDATRVGLLQYGSVVQPEFSLNTYGSRAEVEQAVKNMEHLATGTMTGLAIQYTMETAFTEDHGARPLNMHIPRIAMIVTDGRPQDTVKEVAAEARKAGIQIFAIGVGRVDMKILKTIGSEPHSEHVHLVANFSQIESLISVFQSKLCGGNRPQRRLPSTVIRHVSWCLNGNVCTSIRVRAVRGGGPSVSAHLHQHPWFIQVQVQKGLQHQPGWQNMPR